MMGVIAGSHVTGPGITKRIPDDLVNDSTANGVADKFGMLNFHCSIWVGLFC